MIKVDKYIRLFVLGLFVVIASCKRNPTDRLVNSINDGAVPQTSGIYTIYDNELKTGGGLGLIPGGESQAIDLNDQSIPKGSLAQIRYEWNGQPVASQQLFAGFSLLITPDFTTLGQTPARDLSAPGYTKMVFNVRGALGTGVSLRVEGPSKNIASSVPARLDLTRSEIGSTYATYTLNIPGSDFVEVKSFATITCQFTQPPRTTNPSNGCIIFLDDIRYEQ